MTHFVLEPMHVHWMKNCARDVKNLRLGTIMRIRCGVLSSYQLHDQFRDAGFQSVCFELFIGKNVNSLPFFNRNEFFGRIAH